MSLFFARLCSSFHTPLAKTRATRRMSSSSYIDTLFNNVPPNYPVPVAAPMVSQSEFAFRELCRIHGTKLTFTQMIHAKNFVLSEKHRKDNYDFNPALEGLKHDAPVIAQLAGNDADVILEAAKMIESTGIDGIDLNLGCPQRIAKKGNYGAFLLPSTDVICEIVSKLANSLTVPVSVKIRLQGPEKDLATVRRLEEAGASLITVHGRTVKENKTATKECNRPAIKRIVDNTNVPIIGNGGVEFLSDVAKFGASTGVVGVMSSEALLENPALFEFDDLSRKSKTDFDLTVNQIYTRQLALAKEYLALCKEYPPIGIGQFGGSSTCKAHIFKILYRLFNRRENVDLRNKLGLPQTNQVEMTAAIVQELEDRYLGRVLSHEGESIDDCIRDSWYRRHRSPAEEILPLMTKTISIEERKKSIRARLKM